MILTDNPGKLVGNGRRKTVIISPPKASCEVALRVGIYKYEPSSPVAKAYAEFAKEVSADGRKKERLHSADAR